MARGENLAPKQSPDVVGPAELEVTGQTEQAAVPELTRAQEAINADDLRVRIQADVESGVLPASRVNELPIDRQAEIDTKEVTEQNAEVSRSQEHEALLDMLAARSRELGREIERVEQLENKRSMLGRLVKKLASFAESLLKVESDVIKAKEEMRDISATMTEVSNDPALAADRLQRWEARLGQVTPYTDNINAALAEGHEVDNIVHEWFNQGDTETYADAQPLESINKFERQALDQQYREQAMGSTKPNPVAVSVNDRLRLMNQGSVFGMPFESTRISAAEMIARRPEKVEEMSDAERNKAAEEVESSLTDLESQIIFTPVNDPKRQELAEAHNNQQELYDRLTRANERKPNKLIAEQLTTLQAKYEQARQAIERSSKIGGIGANEQDELLNQRRDEYEPHIQALEELLASVESNEEAKAYAYASKLVVDASSRYRAARERWLQTAGPYHEQIWRQARSEDLGPNAERIAEQYHQSRAIFDEEYANLGQARLLLRRISAEQNIPVDGDEQEAADASELFLTERYGLLVLSAPEPVAAPQLVEGPEITQGEHNAGVIRAALERNSATEPADEIRQFLAYSDLFDIRIPARQTPENATGVILSRGERGNYSATTFIPADRLANLLADSGQLSLLDGLQGLEISDLKPAEASAEAPTDIEAITEPISTEAAV